MARRYREWQFFNRKPAGSYRLMQACFDGSKWSFGFGVDPARVWLCKSNDSGKLDLQFHSYLPFARWNEAYIGFMVTIGWRRDGTWRKVKWPQPTP